MRVVADANKIAAALIRPNGFAAGVLRREDIDWHEPAFLLEELADHAGEYADRGGVSEAVLRARIVDIEARLHFVSLARLLAAKDDERVQRAARVDPDDAPYVAAFVASAADVLWTSDKRLRAALPEFAVGVVPPPVRDVSRG